MPHSLAWKTEASGHHGLLEVRFMDREKAAATAQEYLPAAGASDLLTRVQRLRDGTPLFLVDLRPAPFWFQFGLHLSATQRGSTLRNYAHLAALFARFIQSRGLSVDTVREADIVDYRESRTNGPKRISLVSWKLDAVVIQSIYDFAIHLGICDRAPWFVSGGRSALRQPLNAVPESRGLSVAQWQEFLHVGLMGRTPGSGADPSFRVQWAIRNVVAAQLAISTGLRVQEFASLLLPELASADSPRGGAYLTLEAVTKGQRRRTVYIPSGVVARLRAYIRTDRATLVAHLNGRTSIPAHRRFIVDEWRSGDTKLSGTVDDTRVTMPLEKVPLELRARAFYRTPHGLEPLALFVNSWGRMTRPRTWHRVFASASQRVASFPETSSAARYVQPHTLRHTFARRYLAQLNIAAHENAGRDEWGEIDSLTIVQRALGHASLDTTVKYISDDGMSRVVEDLFHDADDPLQDFSELIDLATTNQRQRA